MKNNLFNYATGELSQDAFLCYLFAFAQEGIENQDSQLAAMAEDFLKKILNENWPDRNLISHHFIVKDIRRQYPVRIQDKNGKIIKGNIDILLTIQDATQNNTYYMFVEDKVATDTHDNQLTTYHTGLKNQGKPLEYICGVYYKILEQAHLEHGVINRTRKDMLNILNKYDGNNTVILDYRSYLQEIEKQTDSWKTTPMEQWNDYAYRGFFTDLSKQTFISYCPVLDGWGQINYKGSFWGFWWRLDTVPHLLFGKLEEQTQYRQAPRINNVYLQLEQQGKKVHKKPIWFKEFRICVKFTCQRTLRDGKLRWKISSWFWKYLNEKHIPFKVTNSWAHGKHSDDKWILQNKDKSAVLTLGYITYDTSNYRERFMLMEQAQKDFITYLQNLQTPLQ